MALPFHPPSPAMPGRATMVGLITVQPLTNCAPPDCLCFHPPGFGGVLRMI